MWCLRTVQRAAITGNNILQVSQSSQEVLKCSVLHYLQARSHKAVRHPSKVIFPKSDISLKEETVIDLDRRGFAVEKPGKNKGSSKGSRGRGDVTEKSVSKSSQKSSKSLISSKTLSPDTITKPLESLESLESSESSDSDSEEIQKNNVEKLVILRKSIRSSIVLGKPTDPVFTDEGEVFYTKLVHKDTNISQLLLKLKSKRLRGISGMIMVEGWRFIADGIKSGCQLRTLIFSDTEDLKQFKSVLPATGVRVFKIPYHEIQMWSNLTTSPGIIGVFDTPVYPINGKKDNTYPINIVCDNIREPGNLGAVLRMADGVGCERVFLSAGCVDLWDPKVIRSAAGAHFRLNIEYDKFWSDIKRQIPEDTEIFIADNNCIDETVKLGSENLTKAFTFEERLKSKNAKVQNGQENQTHLSIPIVPYYDVNFSKSKSITIVIGGETEGLSDECYRFGHERNGTRINIPLKDGVDSLNTGMALAVVVFEIKRQLLKASTVSLKQ